MSEPQNPQPTPEPAPAPQPDGTTPPPSPSPEPAPPINYAGATTGTPPVPKDANDRTMGMLCHLLALLGHFYPPGHIIGPLVIWLLKKDTSPFVDDQGKESLNFQITMTIAYVAAGLSFFICVGWVLLPAIVIFDLIVVIIATVKASQGIAYRYPLSLRLIN